jgi:hypothetical protein
MADTMIFSAGKRMNELFGLPGRALTALALLGPVFPGCGGDPDLLPTVPVSGTLAVDGKPVAKGAIHFHPQKGQTANGIVADGRFTLSTYKEGDGAVAGKHRVAVEVNTEVPMKDGDTTAKSLIPKKYASPDESGIELEIPAKGLPNLQIDLLKDAVRIKED